MKKETYNLEQIEKAIDRVYDLDSFEDSWGFPVIYREEFVDSFRRRIKKLKTKKSK